MQLIQLFRENDWEVGFATSAAFSRYAADLRGLEVETYRIELNDSSFDDFISNLAPDMVLYDRFMTEEQYGWRVRQQCPKAMTILDTEDLHCLREARQRACMLGREFEEADLYSEVAKREIASIHRCDLSIMISDYEMEVLQRNFQMSAEKLIHSPFMLNSINNDDVSKWLPFNNRNHFISIGNFLHEPNWNSVLYLKEEIWPMIRAKLQQPELHIYGAYPSPKVENLNNPSEGFMVKGRAMDAKKVVGEARVLLAPLRFGAGLKGKLIEAMQCGIPSVTTQIGAESMHGDLPWPGVIANEPETFAKGAIRLYTDAEKWENSQQKGVRIINELYNKHAIGDALINRINKILLGLQSHRRQHFTGEILHHDLHGRTKYMSKWIEAKNSKGQVN